MNEQKLPEVDTSLIPKQFKLIRSLPIENLKAVFCELVHQKTGAKFIHLASHDDNNVFMVAFRTLPENSTGVAHILEHGVLEGSRRYPVRAYKGLSGRSLNTFLNAMTGADYTAYPFASRNKKDFFNVMSIYLDATFFPLLRKETFLQEGWRYEFEDTEDPSSQLVYKGVVYNEMKGALGNPLRMFHEAVKRAVFPDLIFRHVSGGDPQVIPELTYEDWKQFHARHYHPSNAYFYTHGNIPLHEILEAIDHHVLNEFQDTDPPAPTPIQKSYQEPVKLELTYPVSETADTQTKSFIAVLWKLAPVSKFYENLKLALLNIILCGDNTALLNRELIKSGLGGGLAPVGFDDSFSESMFGAGLKDTDPEKADQIEKLILETLQNISTNGIAEDEIEAALHQLEFSTREIKGEHGVPAGLHLAMRSFHVWMNGGDFYKSLTIDEHLARLREEANDSQFFRHLISTYLLKNPHRATLVLRPEPGAIERQARLVASRLSNIKSQLTSSDVKTIDENVEALKKYQDKEEDRSCLPSVTREDIPEDPDDPPAILSHLKQVPLFRHPIPTNGISYLTLLFDMPFYSIEPSLSVSLLGIIKDLGAAGLNYLEMSGRIKKSVGALQVNIFPFRNLADSRLHFASLISSRCLPRNHSKMTEILGDVVLKPEFGDMDRIRNLIAMKRAYVIPAATFNAHRMALVASARAISPLRRFFHFFEGLGFIQRLMRTSDDQWGSIVSDMETVLKTIVLRNHLNISFTGLDDQFSDIQDSLASLVDRLPVSESDDSIGSGSPDTSTPVRDAWIIDTEVSYVAKSYPAAPYEDPDAPVLHVISGLMEMPLYDEIRAKGGAYGAFAIYDAESAIFSLVTYRDPQTNQSLNAFDNVIFDLADGNFTDEQLDHAIINIIRSLDVPPSPNERGLSAFMNRMKGLTYEARKKHRKGILNTTREDVCRIVDKYFTRPIITGISVITSDEILKRPDTSALNLDRFSLISK
ncbi:insulinase family protein [bacterium]|nr:insulinase family protein [candidate division CSSED10-310 bacterium]